MISLFVYGILNIETEVCEFILTENAAIKSISLISYNCISSASWDNKIKTWNLATKKIDASCYVYGLFCFIPLSEDSIITGSFDTSVRIWNLKTEDSKKLISTSSSMIMCVTTLYDGRIIAGFDPDIDIWDIDNNFLYNLKGHKENVTCIAELKDGRIVSGSSDNTIIVWY